MASTLKDVAKEAGVAVSTASRALSGQQHVDERTRQAVIAAARKVGYRPNGLARALRSRDTRTIGVVLPDMLNYFYAASTAVLQDQFEAQGYGMLLAVTGNDKERERRGIQRMLSAQVEGLVVVPMAQRGITVEGLPIVEMNRGSQRTVDRVLSDDETGVRECISHLLRLGHRRIGLILGEPQFSTTQRRLSAAVQTVAELCPGASVVPVEGEHRESWGADAMNRLLDSHDPPTAVFAASSELALGAMHALRSRGIEVPRQMSLVAFGSPDWFLVAGPAITCYEQALAQVGMITAQVLLSRIVDPSSPPATVRVSGRFCPRASTAPPRGEAV